MKTNWKWAFVWVVLTIAFASCATISDHREQVVETQRIVVHSRHEPEIVWHPDYDLSGSTGVAFPFAFQEVAVAAVTDAIRAEYPNAIVELVPLDPYSRRKPKPDDAVAFGVVTGGRRNGDDFQVGVGLTVWSDATTSFQRTLYLFSGLSTEEDRYLQIHDEIVARHYFTGSWRDRGSDFADYEAQITNEMRLDIEAFFAGHRRRLGN